MSPQPNLEFKKFYSILKVDEQTHTVYGLATSEAKDSENERCDYDSGKKAIQAWSNDAIDRTARSGAELSCGNLRVMHNLEVGGKATRIDYDDTAKKIFVESTPATDEIWEMLKGGFLAGLSIGGSVDKRKKDSDGVIRYWVKEISEISYVDSPANPEAVFAYVKADGSTELRKFQRHPDQVLTDIAANARKTAQEFAAAANSPEGGSMALFSTEQLEQIKSVILLKDAKTKRVAGEDLPSSAFAYVGDKDDPSTWKLPIHFSSEEKSKRHVRNALARFNQTKGIPEDEKEAVHAKIVAAAKKYGIDVEGEKAKADAFVERVRAALKKSIDGDEVKKGMWDIGVLAETLSTLSYLYYNCLMEAMWEEDDRDDVLAVELAAAVEHLVVILKDMVDEETSELIPALKAAQLELKLLKGEKAMEVDEVLDIAKELADLAKAGHTMKAHFHKMASHHEKMAAHHEKHAAHHEALMETHKDMEEAHKACKGKKASEADGGDTAAFHTAGAAHHKKAAAEHGGLHKAHMKCHEAHKAMAEHCKAMGEKHEDGLPEGDKAAKAAADKVAADAVAKAAADKVIADKAAADKAAADAAAKAAGGDLTLASVLVDLKKSIDTGNETMGKMQKSIDDLAAAPHTPGTPAAKAAGLELVNRGPATGTISKAAIADVGI